MSKVIKLENKKIAKLKLDNKSDKFIGFTNVADNPDFKGKAIYLNINNITSIFSTNKNTTILHNGTTGWEVLESLEEVIKKILLHLYLELSWEFILVGSTNLQLTTS